jgi:dihydroneopterin aldolase
MKLETIGNRIDVVAARTPSTCLVGVENYPVQALIGVYAHELNCRQLLIVTTTLEVDPPEADSLEQAVNYSQITTVIEAVASNHTKLIECFATKVARACLMDPRVAFAHVRVQKPSALPAGIAWTEISLPKR